MAPLTCHFVVLLVLTASIGFSQRVDSLELRDINFNKLNALQSAIYIPKKAKDGKDGDARLTITLFRTAKHGNNGKDGTLGSTLHVYVSAMQLGDSAILRLKVEEVGVAKRPDIYYVNPRFGQIIISANGGDGGNGGRGQDGKPQDEKHFAADGGNGGNGGNGGGGGTIRVTMDSSALGYVNCSCILYFNKGGIGGSGGDGGAGGQTESVPGVYSRSGDAGNPGLNGSDGPTIEVLATNGKLLSLR